MLTRPQFFFKSVYFNPIPNYSIAGLLVGSDKLIPKFMGPRINKTENFEKK